MRMAPLKPVKKDGDKKVVALLGMRVFLREEDVYAAGLTLEVFRLRL